MELEIITFINMYKYLKLGATSCSFIGWHVSYLLTELFTSASGLYVSQYVQLLVKWWFGQNIQISNG